MLEKKIQELNIDSKLKIDILNKYQKYKIEKNSSIVDWNPVYTRLKEQYVYNKEFTKEVQYILSIVNLAIKYTNKNSIFDEEELQLLDTNYKKSSFYEFAKINGLKPVNKVAAKVVGF